MRDIKRKELEKYINELKWIKKTIIDDSGKFVSVSTQDFELNNGRIIRREQILKNKNDGSAVIIIPEVNDEYLVTIEPRVFTKKRIAVSFPAGYIEAGEKMEDSAIRELREETGYTSDSLVHLDSFYQDEGISAAYNHVFLANNCIKKYDQHLDKDEVVRYMSFTYDELLELEREGFISGANCKLALLRLRDYKERR